MREPSAKKGKADLDNSMESSEKLEMSTHSIRHGADLRASRISQFESDGMGIDQAILHSIECCGMLHP